MNEGRDGQNTKKQVPLRLSPSLYAALVRWAEEDFRSLNAQIEYLLSECVKERRGRTRSEDGTEQDNRQGEHHDGRG